MALRYMRDPVADAFRRAAHMLILARLDTDAPLCLCSWLRDAEAALPGRDTETYHGGGWLGALPALTSIIDGTAQDVAFPLSGVAPAIVDLFVARAPSVRGRLLEIAAQPFSAAMTPLAAPMLFARLTGQRLAYSYQPGEGGRASATITLTCSNGDTTRSRGHATHWTPAQYKDGADGADGSTLTDWVARYVPGYTATWPRY